MLTPKRSSRFKRDVKLQQKRGKDTSRLKDVLVLLVQEKPIPSQHSGHQLQGNWNNYRCLHIEPDWILIYKSSKKVIYLARTGRHSDILEK